MAKKGKILIVEDDEDIRSTLHDYLEIKEYDVLVASDGVEAVKQLLDYDVKVIITDYKMEVFGGNYWVKFLEKYCKDIQVFITSGFLDNEKSIPFQVIHKPFDYEEIEHLIDSCLDR